MSSVGVPHASSAAAAPSAGAPVSAADALERLSTQLQQLPKQTGTLIMDHAGVVVAVSARAETEAFAQPTALDCLPVDLRWGADGRLRLPCRCFTSSGDWRAERDKRTRRPAAADHAARRERHLCAFAATEQRRSRAQRTRQPHRSVARDQANSPPVASATVRMHTSHCYSAFPLSCPSSHVQNVSVCDFTDERFGLLRQEQPRLAGTLAPFIPHTITLHFAMRSDHEIEIEWGRTAVR